LFRWRVGGGVERKIKKPSALDCAAFSGRPAKKQVKPARLLGVKGDQGGSSCSTASPAPFAFAKKLNALGETGFLDWAAAKVETIGANYHMRICLREG